VESAPM